MTVYADLHVHSHYSRATSRDLDLEHLAWWASRKGIGLVGTGDCVHPGWRAEIGEKLVDEGNGLFRLRPDIEAAVLATLPASCRQPVRFMLTTEISTIYKKGDKTRKVHHLICLPGLDAADRLAGRLAAIGNIASDGRPILGLDSRDLLETTLESGAGSFLVPAHIWTPWFAALGSQSGFESIADCYGDLSEHIFAVETGLSSDPEMNWRVSSLDRYRLISNSDAHSPSKLAREATAFSRADGFMDVRNALETGAGYRGTVEFFPEEGKYHMDGHRACGVRLSPRETLDLGGICPKCGKPLTIGVAHRVEVLADREIARPPANAGIVESLVPLPEILSEILGSGAGSQTVIRSYDRVAAALGPELPLLTVMPVEEIAATDPLLAEAITRLRAGSVIRDAGYDGEYGVIRLFADGELERKTRGGLLFDAPRRTKVRPDRTDAKAARSRGDAPRQTGAAPHPAAKSGRKGVLADLDPDQADAASLIDGALAVIAGPGSGKTRMLTHRIAHLVKDRAVPADACLAVTFTRRATIELRERLSLLLPGRHPAVESFHSLGLSIVKAERGALGLPDDFSIADEIRRTGALAEALDISDNRAARLVSAVSRLKRAGTPATGADAGDEVLRAADTLARLGHQHSWIDFDDLIALPVALLSSDTSVRDRWQRKYSHILADEFQDIDAGQYRLLRLLSGPGGNLCVVGDPDQAIYGFRGADETCFDRFRADYPESRTVRLTRNYRSSGSIVIASQALMGRDGEESVTRSPGAPISLHLAADERTEADFVATAIAELMGGHDLLSATTQAAAGRPLGFADFAVLYRTDAQAAALREALDRAGLPVKKSRPAPLSTHPGVVALLAALADTDPGPLLSRLTEAGRRVAAEEGADPAVLAESLQWLRVLAQAQETDAPEADPPACAEARLREKVALATETDFHDRRADRVSLLTMHAAKGLEFPVVLVAGLDDGVTPFSFPDDRPEEGRTTAALEEERRLFYVAMTRAMDRLILTRARERVRFGQVRPMAPSPFLDSLPPALIRRTVAGDRKRPPRQLTLFPS
ncbi:MAG: AAA family ATPase [Telmatospirillum sp.]|nr:AAA family ATPase [Telmatospirillum sp.]